MRIVDHTYIMHLPRLTPEERKELARAAEKVKHIAVESGCKMGDLDRWPEGDAVLATNLQIESTLPR
jgi:hypothetical protein